MLRADTTYVTAAQLAARWKKSAYTVCEYAKQGRIDGAQKEGNELRFPERAVLKPAARVSNGEDSVGMRPLANARERLRQMKEAERERSRRV